jgi:signal transduction histidine kinase
LECDGAKIVQVIQNLLTNAVKFSPPKSLISISAERSELPDRRANCDNRPAVTIMVKDEGDGIPNEELESIFDQFVQSSKTRSGGGGTGLGLAICREIVSLHAGTIHAENNPERGTTIVILLPLSQNETQ